MKKWLNKQKIFLIILILIIISGIITLGIAGLEKSLEYKAGTRIEVYIPKGYEKQDIINIAKESFVGKEISFVEIEKLNQIAGIKVSEYTQEEMETFKSSISQKYEIEKEKIELYEVLVPETKISTIVKPYILPIMLVTILSLVYIGIRSIKTNDVLKKSFEFLITIIMTMAIYFSIIVIFRLPFGSFTMPLALSIYIITLLIAVKNIKK